MFHKSCIYSIKNIVNQKLYVGSTADLSSRMKIHFYLLGAGKHHCKHLQSAWNKYGPHCFVVEILSDVIDVERLLIVEQEFIDSLLQSGLLYNASICASRPVLRSISAETRRLKSKKTSEQWKDPETKGRMLLAIRKSFTSVGKRAKLSDRTRARMSIQSERDNLSTKARARNADPGFREKFAKSIAKRSTNEAWLKSRFDPSLGIAKITEDDVIFIRMEYSAGSKTKEIAEKLGVSCRIVRNVINGKTWKHVK